MIGVACKTVNGRKAPLCNDFLEDVSIQSPVTRVFKVSKAIGNLVLVTWDPCGKQGMSCSIVSEIILSTMLFKRKSVLYWPINLTTLELSVNGLVPNDVQKGFKTVKK